MMGKTVKLKVDDVHYNASHYSSFTKEEAVKRITTDYKHMNVTEKWAESLYNACVDAVKQDQKTKS